MKKKCNIWVWLLLVIVISGLLSDSCKKEEETKKNPTLPELITRNVTVSQDDGYLIVYSGGTILSDGGIPILSRGVCWSTNESPSILDNKTSIDYVPSDALLAFSIYGTGTGSFLSRISSEKYHLSRLTTYFLRAYATNSLGTSYGNEVSFTTLCFWDLIFIGNQVISITSPANSSVGQSTNPILTWISYGRFIENFDIYLDTNPNPTTKIASNITSKSLPVSGLASSTTYYWKVFGWESAYPCNNVTSGIYKFTTVGLP
jgi:hypothetical protein